MGMYTLSRSNLALPVSTDDLLTIIPATNRSFDLIEASIGGMGTVSAAGELQVARSNGGVTPTVPVAHEPHREAQAAAALSSATTWGTQPTLGDVIARLTVNANGGVYRWIRLPGQIITFSDGDTDKNLSFRAAVGTPVVSFHTIVEEF